MKLGYVISGAVIAVVYDNVRALEKILEKKLLDELTIEYIFTLALLFDRAEIVKKLYENYEHLPDLGFCLSFEFTYRNPKILQYLYESNCLTLDFENIFLKACCHADLQSVKILIEQFAFTSKIVIESGFVIACELGHAELGVYLTNKFPIFHIEFANTEPINPDIYYTQLNTKLFLLYKFDEA